MKREKRVFALYEGRHELPENEGAIFTGFDFQKFKPIGYNEKFFRALNKGEDIEIIVTGLTPALTYVISLIINTNSSLTLLHFNRETGKYVKQIIK